MITSEYSTCTKSGNRVLPYGQSVAARAIARNAVGPDQPGVTNAMNHNVAGYQFPQPFSLLINRDGYDAWYDAMTANGHRVRFA